MITHQDSTGTTYTGTTANKAVSGETVTVFTPTETKQGTMIGGQVQY